ncbi:diacylglycerol O-acyltransferase 1 [Pancytospora philotis]|nr:diacylglycerol O-acyltransferase 1 [Pancytospora philotis]
MASRAKEKQPADAKSRMPIASAIPGAGSESPRESRTLRTHIGWINLVTIIALLSVARSIVLNIMEYGFIIESPLAQLKWADTLYFLVVFALNATRACLFYAVSAFAWPVAAVYILLSEGLMSLLVFRRINYVYMRSWAHIILLITDLKLVSFLVERCPSTLEELLRFMVLPTLMYKQSYAWKESRSFALVGRHVASFIAYYLLFVFLMDQYAIPSVYRIIEHDSAFSLMDSCVNLSISTILLFIVFFQLVFNGFLAIVAELTGFAETAYGEWWNSATAAEFWKCWNIPVHQFINNYLHKPMVRRGVPRPLAMSVCFVLSGAVHEYVTAMAMRKLTGYMFLAMVSQAPFMYVSDVFTRRFPAYGNMFFWLMFSAIGQPLTVLLIFRAHYIEKAQDIEP